MIKKTIKRILEMIGSSLSTSVRDKLIGIQVVQNDIKKIASDSYTRNYLFENPKYSNPKRLNKYQYQTYSQNMEDGIIQEIFQRIGNTNKFFVEFGVDNGLECNSILLLLQDWNGCWMDGGQEKIKNIQEKFSFLIKDNKLLVKQAFITAENIEKLFNSLSIPREFDLLSIDIDRNDYWVWEAIKNYSPRVVIIEYNAMFKPPMEFIVKYEANKVWDGTSYFGASLKSLELLGLKKGYKLVGCDFVGVNAFFIREDLVGDKFFEPFTAETHHEPPRYFLLSKTGHPREFGRFENRTSVYGKA